MRLRTLTLRLPLPRRPRFQYGLRWLLLLTLVLCLGLGWYVERVRRQRRAVALLTGTGAKIKYYDSHYGQPGFHQRTRNIWAPEYPTLFCERVEYWLPSRLRDALGVDFFRPVDSVSFREAVPDYCRDLTGVRYAKLDDVLDEDLANIGALSDLNRLYLPHSYISDAGLKLRAYPRTGGAGGTPTPQCRFWDRLLYPSARNWSGLISTAGTRDCHATKGCIIRAGTNQLRTPAWRLLQISGSSRS